MQPIESVLETVLYYTDEQASRRFYAGTLGMRLIGEEAGRQLFFRVGSSVLLLFNPEATTRPGSLPPHGAHGPGHVCFQVAAEAYAGWRRHLEDAGVEILQEVDWPPGSAPPVGLSFYFRDPSGNLLEIANADFWPE